MLELEGWELVGNCCIMIALVAGAILFTAVNVKDCIDVETGDLANPGEGFIND